jgi:O-antigen ligase
MDAIFVALGTLMAFYSLSIVLADETLAWAAESYRWGVSALFLIMARPYFTVRSRRRVVIVLAALSAGAAMLAIAQVLSDSGPASFTRAGWTRAYGTFGEPNAYAAFIRSVTLPVMAFALLTRSRWSRQRIAMLAAALASLGALALTQSRGGALGLAAGVAVIGLVVLGRSRFWVQCLTLGTTAILAGLIVVTAVAGEPWNVRETETTPSNWANQERAAHWAAAVEMVRNSPVLGVGAGGFKDQYRSATTHWRFRISQGHGHNAYLQVAAEAGLGALAAYLMLIGGIVGSLVRRTRAASEPWFETGVLAVTVALFAHQLVDYLHALSLGLLFAGLWAAALETGSKGMPVSERDIVA